VRNPEELEYADVLLGDHPKAGIALDLLLGTQGWRRFAEQDPIKFQKQQHLARVQQQQPNFLANSVMVPQVLDLEQKHLAKLDESFVKDAIDLEKKLAATEDSQAGPAGLVEKVAVSETSMAQVEQSVAQADSRLRAFKSLLIQVGLGLGVLALVFVAFFCISVGLRRLSDASGNDRGWLGSGLALLGVLFIISLVGTFGLRGIGLFDRDRFGPQRFMGMPKVPQAAANGGQTPPGNAVPVIDERAIAEVAGSKDENKVDDPAPAPQPPKEAIERLVARQAPDPIEFRKADGEREMRQQGNYQALLQKHLGRRVLLPPLSDPSVVRVYAWQQKPNANAVRRDLAETVYWHPVLVMPAGKADVTFDLPDSATRFQVLILSNTFDGRLGTNRLEFTSNGKGRELRAK